MYASYRVKTDELGTEFVAGLKAEFKGREISIEVYDVEEQDSTASILADRNFAGEILKRLDDLNHVLPTRAATRNW